MELRKIDEWMCKNKLFINHWKTKFLLIKGVFSTEKMNLKKKEFSVKDLNL